MEYCGVVWCGKERGVMGWSEATWYYARWSGSRADVVWSGAGVG